MAILEVNVGDSFVCAGVRGFDGRPERRDCEHAATRGRQFVAAPFRTCMENLDILKLRCVAQT